MSLASSLVEYRITMRVSEDTSGLRSGSSGDTTSACSSTILREKGGHHHLGTKGLLGELLGLDGIRCSLLAPMQLGRHALCGGLCDF